ncbi:hypothetical protein [Streptomyces sp. NPDC047939]|uniref:hypothetical protein n=1 Tax=Streptomyces sp. NPDC047939 TaxID=3155381 RepID=UPI003426CB46
MNNATGSTGDHAPRPTTFDLIQPLGRLRLVYNTGAGLKSERIDFAPANAFGITGGTIRDIHMHGDDDEPRATFTLVGLNGDSAIVAVGTDAYFDSFGDIVDGAEVEVRGMVIRPFRDGPAHLQLLSLYIA